MSRLFDAISRIEARKHGADPPPFALRERTKRRWKGPWILSSIAVGVIAGAGILAIVAVSGIDTSKLRMNSETLRPLQTTETSDRAIRNDAGSPPSSSPPVQQQLADAPPASSMPASNDPKPSIPSESGSGIGTRDSRETKLLPAVDEPPAKAPLPDAEIRIPDKLTALQAPASQKKAQMSEAEETPIPDVMEAQAMISQGRIEEACRIYQAAWRREKDPVIGNNLAATLIMLKRPDEARKILEEAISIAPDDEDIRYNLELAKTMTREGH
ncbi:MAG: tetratricopeptide repeat protein [Deltaproteobacteria bacterium]